MKKYASVVLLLFALTAAVATAGQQVPAGGAPAVGGQAGPGRGRGAPPATARAAAAFDMTGYWVSVVTEDWRWRMLTPPKGDYSSVPLNPEGQRVADTWDWARDRAMGNECRAFGAAAVMRQPGRLRISWQDDSTLKIETSAGSQTRLLQFVRPVANGQPIWQGLSFAEWRKQPQVAGLGFGGRGSASVAGGNLKVTTTSLRAGYLRPNGVPYSEDATVTEYFNRHTGPRDLEWLTVTTVVEDPKYLAQPFVTSTDFKKEPDGSKFSPTPCEIERPRLAQSP